MTRRKEGMSGGEERNLSKVTNLRNAENRGGETDKFGRTEGGEGRERS